MDFDDFYREEHGQVLGLCLLVTLDVEAAADAAQEAMLRAWTNWDQLAGGRPGAWVRTVALNLCRSRWRQLQRELRLTPRSRSVVLDPPVRDPALVAALRGLPRRQREAIVLFYWADLSVEECAAQMGVSIGSVKQHLSRGRSRLGEDEALSPLRGAL